MLDADLAGRFAALTLAHLGRQWPYKLDQILTGPDDVRTPAEIHPIFHGSFDWHSCVHGWWQVTRLARLFPGAPFALEVAARTDAMLTPANVAGELDTFSRPLARGASRPYGRAWLLALHAELAPPHAAILAPLAGRLAADFHVYWASLTYPIRVGTHFNSAFAMWRTLDWAARHDPVLLSLIRDKALIWFGNDRAAQAWEPGGDDFLSGTLVEALLMSRLLGPAFPEWFDRLLPDSEHRRPATLFTPAIVSDRTDGKIAHLDGLNLSRAWCWRGIAAALPPGHPAAPIARAAAADHLAAGLPHVAGDYMGEHWLATYALLALDG
jgi:hypothetical protein